MPICHRDQPLTPCMNQFSQSIVVLPCHSLEDFPTHVVGDEASSLLANWTACWHPRLISLTKSAPGWCSQDFVDCDLDNAIIFVPTLCNCLASEFEEAVDRGGAYLIADKVTRAEILMDPVFETLLADSPDSDCVRDFFALGYAALQVQIMTRQLRYSSTLDQAEFNRRVIDAANSTTRDDVQSTKAKLSSCFDLLLQERSNFYPAEINLLELVLTPPSAQLGNQLNVDRKINYWFSGILLEAMASEEADQLKQRIETGDVGFCTAGFEELPTRLVSIESVVNQFQRGIEVSESRLGTSSRTYGSYRMTLNPHAPNIAELFRQDSLIHVAFSSGAVPFTSAPVINWQGTDGTNVSAISTPPIDANSSAGLLKLGLTIGEMLDGHHHAVLLFVHWPNRTSEFFEDFARIESYGGLFGTFRTLKEFNETIYDNGYSDNFEAEDYKHYDLQNSFQDKFENPISRWSNYWRQLLRLRALNQLYVLSDCSNFSGISTLGLSQRTGVLQSQLEAETLKQNDAREAMLAIAKLVEDELGVLCLQDNEIANIKSDALVINPSQFRKHVAIHSETDTWQSLVPLQPFEFSPVHSIDSSVETTDPPILLKQLSDEPPILRNDFFEIQFDTATGGIQSVNRHAKKGNLFSQQLAARLTESVMERGYPRQRSRYTDVQCNGWNHRSISNLAASVESSGSLFDRERPIADFKQTVTVRRCDSCIYFSIELDLKEDIQGPPWRNYVASRMAWANENAKITRAENETADAVYQEKITAPNFVEIADEQSKIALLAGGLPYHRRSHRRMLDTLLLVEHERARRFDFAVAIDPVTAMAAATNYLTPVFICQSDIESSPRGWIFHLNCQNVLLTYAKSNFDPSGKLIGVTMRFQETEGQSGEMKLACPFKIQQARRTNLVGEVLFELGFDQDVVQCSFLAYQYIQLEIRKKQNS